MATNLVRYELDGAPHWGVVSALGISPLDSVYPTTAALIDQGETDWRGASGRAASLPSIGADPFAGDGALPHLLPGRELSPTYD